MGWRLSQSRSDCDKIKRIEATLYIRGFKEANKYLDDEFIETRNKMKCTLSENINNCPFCNKDKMECNNEKDCAFQEKEVVKEKEKYIRKERWYEKYYRK